MGLKLVRRTKMEDKEVYDLDFDSSDSHKLMGE
jgi:hypothetical protein